MIEWQGPAGNIRPANNGNGDGDNLSFEDSDRFEEDSLCSWVSEQESVCTNWRGWKRPTVSRLPPPPSAFYSSKDEDGVLSLVELCARQVAAHIPFEVVERVYPPVPEQIQLRITYWSFPDSEEDIRLYSCLANGSADEFAKGEHLFRSSSVHEPLQIGFHLSARVEAGVAGFKGQYNVAVTLDRKRINACTCTCSANAAWCSHIVAVCLQRIHQPTSVILRAPVSESLSRLTRDQLQKFAQYLISELSHDMLPTAQRLLDDLLSGKPSRMNLSCGAPDPTAGASVADQTSWCLDQRTLQENIRKILIKFCLPSPTVFSDVNCLSTSAPPAAAEWTSLLRPLRGREPEGMWNLLSIVREMMRRHDRNAVPLLEIITEECLQCDQIVIWWVNTKLTLHSGGSGHAAKNHATSNSQASQHACASLCEEIVVQWRLAALSATLSQTDRDQLREQFLAWHLKVLDKYKSKSQSGGATGRRQNDMDGFPGFKPAIEACHLSWDNYRMTSEGGAALRPERIRHAEPGLSQQSGPVHSSDAVLQMLDGAGRRLEAGNRSSVSSEGFCETEDQEGGAAAPADGAQREPETATSDKERVLAALRPVTDHWEVLFARAEGLHAHGFTRDACRIGVTLAERLLSEPPDLTVEQPPAAGQIKTKKRRGVNPVTHQVTCLASTTLSRCHFLCAVLAEEREHHHLAFQVGLFGLEMSRPPASTKPLEVKLANQEAELLQLVRRIPLGPSELAVLRLRAEQLRSGELRARGDALVPLALANLIVDALVAPSLSPARGAAGPSSAAGPSTGGHRLPGDEELGFAAAVAALGLKANVSEADHPLLCEGTRRQRGDLATVLLVHYKDDQERLARIMDKLLDKEVHRMFKAPTLSSYYSTRPPPSDPRPGRAEDTPPPPPQQQYQYHHHQQLQQQQQQQQQQMGMGRQNMWHAHPRHAPPPPPPPPPPAAASRSQGGARPRDTRGGGAERAPAPGSPPSWEEGYKLWEAKFRCANLKTHRKHHSQGMASIDSSAPETTSSDNSPTLIRRAWAKPSGPGSDSGSSGKSSDSVGSSSSGDAAAAAAAAAATAAAAAHPVRVMDPAAAAAASRPYPALTPESLINRHGVNSKAARFKGKRVYPSVPNQPSEAGAHFMFELAKSVLAKAGGNSSTSLFTQPSDAGAHRGPHRALHMCAFQIGLYALGLHNCVTPNWLSRTYSSNVSWVTGQAMELGAVAIACLVETWEGHLTPAEAAHIADCASRSRDGHVVRAAAGLTLSILPHAHALNQNEIQRALLQCKEQSTELLEKACLAVEGAAKGGGVYPEVLFDIATKWYHLYERTSPKQGGGHESGEDVPLLESPPPPPPPPQGVMDPPPQQVHLSVAAAAAPYPVTYSCLTAAAPNGAQMGVNQLSVQMFVPYGAAQAPAHPFPSAALQLYPAVSMQSMVAAAAAAAGALQPRTQASAIGGGPAVPMFSLPPQPHPHMVMLAPPPPHTAAAHSQPPPPPPIMVPVTLAAAGALQHHRPPPPPPPPPPQQQQQQQHSHQQHPPSPHQQQHQHQQHQQHQQQQHQQHQHQHQHVHQHPPPPPQHHLAQAPVLRTLSSPPLKYLFSTYRVGMLAMETLARRVHDDRATKYSPTPPYGDDVLWLMRVAMKLGTPYVHQFCLCTVNSVVSPFVLFEIAGEVGSYLSRHNTAPPYRSQILTPLVQQCQQMFLSCMHVRLCHVTPAEYDEFVSIVRKARQAFSMTAGGPTQLQEFLQVHRRNKLVKKDLWLRITLALQQPTA